MRKETTAAQNDAFEYCMHQRQRKFTTAALGRHCVVCFLYISHMCLCQFKVTKLHWPRSLNYFPICPDDESSKRVKESCCVCCKTWQTSCNLPLCKATEQMHDRREQVLTPFLMDLVLVSQHIILQLQSSPSLQ